MRLFGISALISIRARVKIIMKQNTVYGVYAGRIRKDSWDKHTGRPLVNLFGLAYHFVVPDWSAGFLFANRLMIHRRHKIYGYLDEMNCIILAWWYVEWWWWCCWGWWRRCCVVEIFYTIYICLYIIGNIGRLSCTYLCVYVYFRCGIWEMSLCFAFPVACVFERKPRWKLAGAKRAFMLFYIYILTSPLQSLIMVNNPKNNVVRIFFLYSSYTLIL